MKERAAQNTHLPTRSSLVDNLWNCKIYAKCSLQWFGEVARTALTVVPVALAMC